MMDSLHPFEIAILNYIKNDVKNNKKLYAVEDIVKIVDNVNREHVNNIPLLTEQQIRSSLERLCTKNIFKLEVKEIVKYKVTDIGEHFYHIMPDEKVLKFIDGLEYGLNDLEILGVDSADVRSAIGRLLRNKVVTVFNKDGRSYIRKIGEDKYTVNLHKTLGNIINNGITGIDEKTITELIFYKFISPAKVKERMYILTSEGEELVNAIPVNNSSENRLLTGGLEHVTPEIIKNCTGEVRMRPYDVSMKVDRRIAGMRNRYLSWIEKIKRSLVGLGFVEYNTPIIENEFWNNDILFMPQEHPARDIHDIFMVDLNKENSIKIDETLLEKVRKMHETGINDSSGWGGKFSVKKSKNIILRSQTTAASMRFLAMHPKPPFKVFTIDKNFRPDAVDSRHNVEFYQCEGIIGGYDLTFRDLLGFMVKLSEIMGSKDVRFKPSYFPFTEPSVEGYINHKKLGWIEALPGGMIRPEIQKLFDIDYPILAWGIGIDRLAMSALGIDDIRMLHSVNLEELYRR